MNKAVCLLPVIPMRADAAHKAEQVSQLIFGDEIDMLERKGDWAFIHNVFDGYEGWVQHRQLSLLNEPILGDKTFITTKPTLVRVDGEMQSFLIPAGCTLPGFYEGKISIGNQVFHISGDVRKAGHENFSDEISSLARSFLHAPYQWGGRTHFGIDCSGFAQIVYKILGLKLPRDAWQQAEKGEVVNFLQEVKAGDLAFFDNEEGRITHVGIMLDNETVIHASASVRIDKMDNQGIYADDLKAYSHKLRIVKRVV